MFCGMNLSISGIVLNRLSDNRKCGGKSQDYSEMLNQLIHAAKEADSQDDLTAIRVLRSSRCRNRVQ